MRRLIRLALALAAAAWAAPVVAADVCVPAPAESPSSEPGARIASIACAENRLWFAPFIDANGRLASMPVVEAESSLLADGVTPAWRRVTEYWRADGLLDRMARFDGATDCAGPLDHWGATASCRAFLIDVPWSAAFVSYVMGRAGISSFNASPRHIDYVRDAHLNPDGPYRLADPARETAAPGDLLCFTRLPAPFQGHEAFRAWLERTPHGRLDMHCDIVVAARASRVYLVGGNVLQGVTLRMLPLNRQGRLWGVQRPPGVAPECHPGNELACNFNRQDWVALLKLQPARAATPPAAPPCCTLCTLPMRPGLRRCPSTVEPEGRTAPPRVVPDAR